MRYLARIIGLAALAFTASPATAQIRLGGPPARQDIKIVGQFDKNGDGWLNAEERKGAREYAIKDGEAGRGFPGGRGVRGGPFGFPGFGGEGGPTPKGMAIA